jgi:DNA repair protein RadC
MAKMMENNDALGHRSRLRERFLQGGDNAIADYELLEMVLFAAKPRGDVKPLAKKLLKKFGSISGVIQANANELKAIEGVGDAVVSSLKIIETCCKHLLKEQIHARPIINSWTSLLDYCRLNMGELKIEQFRVLFLNSKNMLIIDEVMQTGTIDQTAVYPREILKRALELSAASLILVHNHPSGDPTPSKSDIDLTKQIAEAAGALNIKLFEHLIIAKNKHYSFKAHGLV